MNQFPGQFDALTGDSPFPWQAQLYKQLLAGDLPEALDLPTGLGKTSVMAIWLLALTSGAKLPRRLVYVVNRRAVVDQATRVAEKLRDWVDEAELREALGLSRSLPISTLRGQFVDNREWLEDPASPGIVLGTVDMVGSRLLFEGYGCSRKIRPYMAGFLGSDALFVLDESHLVPPFERLLEGVVALQQTFRDRLPFRAKLPRLHVLSLSATGRERERTFRLDPETDGEHPIVQQRLHAEKLVELQETTPKSLPEDLAEQAWELSQASDDPSRIVVYSNSRDVADKARKHLLKLVKRDLGSKAEVPALLFVGQRRVHERRRAARELARHGFLPPEQAEDPDSPEPGSAFVFATAAGEVGVDMDADHMVADLVPWERIVQRLGRVNRRGNGSAKVRLLTVAQEKGDKEAPPEWLEPVHQLLDALSAFSSDACPANLARLDRELVAKASTPPPWYPPLERALAEAWAMTSLQNHTGRPEVQPWLHGWVDDPPRTTLVWRHNLPPTGSSETDTTEFFDAARPHVRESLEVETWRAVGWLRTRFKLLEKELSRSAEKRCAWLKADDPDAILGYVLTGASEAKERWTLGDLARLGRSKDRLERNLAGATLVLPAGLGGLGDEGLLDDKLPLGEPALGLDDGRFDEDADPRPPLLPFRTRVASEGAAEEPWREQVRLPIQFDADGVAVTWLVVDAWHDQATTEDGRSLSNPQLLDAHHNETEQQAREIARRLELDPWLAEVVCVAAVLHDEGKRAARWQQAFNAQQGDAWAKTRGPIRHSVLDGYRHEFGSLAYLERNARFQALDPQQQELVQHLVVAHHGFGRPTIRTAGCDDAPPSALEERAQRVALRFAQLQKRWGPWGLAWLESLVRAADQRASRANDDRGR